MDHVHGNISTDCGNFGRKKTERVMVGRLGVVSLAARASFESPGYTGPRQSARRGALRAKIRPEGMAHRSRCRTLFGGV